MSWAADSVEILRYAQDDKLAVAKARPAKGTYNVCPLRTALSRMRQNLGQRAPFVLRRLFFPTRSCLRLRLAQEGRAPRKPRQPSLQHVALFGTAASAREFLRPQRGWRHAAGRFSQAGGEVGAQESLSEE